MANPIFLPKAVPKSGVDSSSQEFDFMWDDMMKSNCLKGSSLTSCGEFPAGKPALAMPCHKRNCSNSNLSNAQPQVRPRPK